MRTGRSGRIASRGRAGAGRRRAGSRTPTSGVPDGRTEDQAGGRRAGGLDLGGAAPADDLLGGVEVALLRFVDCSSAASAFLTIVMSRGN